MSFLILSQVKIKLELIQVLNSWICIAIHASFELQKVLLLRIFLVANKIVTEIFSCKCASSVVSGFELRTFLSMLKYLCS
jgi:hypothetical protein